jgi:ribosomal protein S18 acetylase RimI-like enzyme
LIAYLTHHDERCSGWQRWRHYAERGEVNCTWRRTLKITIIHENKKLFLDLLLLADEQESMIDRYLERGDIFALYDGDLKSICVVTDEGDGVAEIKNIATYEKYQKRGYGKALIDYISRYYGSKYNKMLVGTGDNTLTISFYEKCGFTISHKIPNFYIDNYDHPIFDDGIQLKDMIYLSKNI